MKKSSTNKKETGKLEEVFRQGFEGAEERPSADLWSRIDQQLEAREVGFYRRKVFWYRQLAAACLALLIGLGTYTYHLSRTGNGSSPGIAADQAANADPARHSTPETNGPRGLVQSPAVAEFGTSRAGAADSSPSAETPSSPAGASGDRATGQAATRSRTGSQPALASTDGKNTNLRGRAKVPAPSAEEVVIARAPRTRTGERRSAGAKGPEAEGAIANAPDKPATPPAEVLREGLEETGKAGPGEIKKGLASRELVARTPEEKVGDAKKGEGAPATGAGEELTTRPVQPRALALQPEKEQEKAAQASRELTAGEMLPPALRRSKWSVSSGYGTQYFAQNISLRNDFYGASRGMASPNFSSAPSNAALTTYDKAVDEFIQNTRPAYSFGATAKAGYQLDRFWRVEAGLSFSQNESQTRTSYLVTGMNILNSQYQGSLASADVQESFKSVATMPSATIMLPALAGLDNRFVSVNKTDGFITRYRYRYVGVPLQIAFQSRQSRSFVFASAGVVPQVLVQSSIIPESNLASRIDFSLGDDSPFRQWNVSASASAGYGYRLNDELSVSVGPEMQYFFAPLIKSSGITHIEQGNPYHVGVNLTARYSFSR